MRPYWPRTRNGSTQKEGGVKNRWVSGKGLELIIKTRETVSLDQGGGGG